VEFKILYERDNKQKHPLLAQSSADTFSLAHTERHKIHPHGVRQRFEFVGSGALSVEPSLGIEGVGVGVDIGVMVNGPKVGKHLARVKNKT
jgi:hypothetical protein